MIPWALSPRSLTQLSFYCTKNDECKEKPLLLRHHQKYEKDERRASKTSVTCNLSAQILICRSQSIVHTMHLRTHRMKYHAHKTYYTSNHEGKKTKDIMILIKLQLQLKKCNTQAHGKERWRDGETLYPCECTWKKCSHTIKSEIAYPMYKWQKDKWLAWSWKKSQSVRIVCACTQRL